MPWGHFSFGDVSGDTLAERGDTVRHVDEAKGCLSCSGLNFRPWYNRPELEVGAGMGIFGFAFSLPDVIGIITLIPESNRPFISWSAMAAFPDHPKSFQREVRCRVGNPAALRGCFRRAWPSKRSGTDFLLGENRTISDTAPIANSLYFGFNLAALWSRRSKF